MNLVLNKKYEIYRSVAATFEGWEDVPATLRPGCIVTVVSIEADKNVVVMDKNKEFWFIRYTSLKNINNEEEVEEEKKEREPPFNWDKYKELVLNKRKDLVVKLRDCNLFNTKGLQKLVNDGVKFVNEHDHGLCTFIWNGNLTTGYVCYAPAMRANLTMFGAAFNRLRNQVNLDNGAVRYVEWVANESALAGAFIAKTFDEITTSITPMAFDDGESKYAIAACNALRWAYESHTFLPIWNELVNEGVDENIAMYLAVQTTVGYNTGNGHTHIYSCPKEALLGWTVRDLPRDKTTIFETCGNSVSYGQDECLVKRVMIDLGFLVKDRYGYYRVVVVVNKEMRMKIAESLAKIVEKEINK